MKNPVLSTGPLVLVNLPSGNDHPVVALPFTASIDGRKFRGRGLSLVAAYVAGLMDSAALNAERIVRLTFEFDGFSVTLSVEAEIREGASGSGEAELIFLRPTGPHLPQLRHILNAYIAGDLVGLDQTIGVAGTAAHKAPKPRGATERRRSLRRVVGGMSVGLASLALVAVVGTLVFQRMFVTLIPTLGTVVSTGEVMRATATGQIAFLDVTARQGDVAVAIQSASGDVQSLVMPCDCGIRAFGQREGSTVLIGEPVLQLTSAGDQHLVEAVIPPAILFDLAAADRIELTFPDGVKALATAERAGPANAGGGAQTIRLWPDAPIAAEQVGTPVEVRILRDAGGLGPWVNSARGRIATLGSSARQRVATLLKGA